LSRTAYWSWVMSWGMSLMEWCRLGTRLARGNGKLSRFNSF
jgi:hypothetical protein